MLPRSLVLRACATVAVLALGTAGLTSASGADAGLSAKPKDPRRSQGLFVDPKMPAYQQGGVYREEIGRVAQAFWVIPEAYPTRPDPDQPWLVPVGQAAAVYTGDAAAAGKTPVLTIYGIPGRDCGMYSSNNPLTTAPQYKAWIKQVAAELEGRKALVVLEPDALPLFSSSVQACPTKPRGWQGMLRFASKRLSRSGAWVYLDAGHSNWTPHETRPAHLKAAGVRFARGISTNVSNFRPTRDEKRYATGLLRGLRKLGVKRKHYVIDTSRNGAAPSNDGMDVINPTWAEVGKKPRLVFRGAFDGTLWVKHPGESDGYENGGPASGQWCDFLADRLLGLPESGSC
ncbi:glycoside hydrolase family 6 protein [Nocardioides sp. LMS-CY]|uniref:glycoside hydrolase family 6 protein n=1 Tax=Nocardioides sp. (strain LMS-CY) TaxID=2840457 RepID=UPI001C0043C1|nr:glycoside hydrolase family 6 protein [Nocardioides sp. LMS-CY]QWF22085.1 glycoside hydrolase family 6 protein [Nocardioides sp. LMS-CY]